MGFRNSDTTYGSVAKFFHWLIALLIIIMLFVGYFMGDWGVMAVYDLHKMTGLFILLLVILRIIWVLRNPRPSLPLSVTRFERIASRIVQGLLYLSLLIMPLSGWAMSTAFGYFPHLGPWVFPMPFIPIDQSLASVFAEIHEITAYFLIAFICLHALGAFKHHFVDKDEVLNNMLPARFIRRKNLP